jgi:alcohol dehydrogenase class IV
MTCPESLLRSTSTTVYLGSLMALGAEGQNPLVEGDRLQAFRLAERSRPHLFEPDNAGHRVDYCAAAFMQNRAADDGAPLRGHWTNSVSYAFATSLHLKYHDLGQGEATSSVQPHVMRKVGQRGKHAIRAIAEALGIDLAAVPQEELHLAAADVLDDRIAALGMPGRLRELGMVSHDDLPAILDGSMKNFNADPTRRMAKEPEFMAEVLESCW